jgi:NAD(P)-dependent dehydrogenase (short-subunit alcohol dehydrogenase family)
MIEQISFADRVAIVTGGARGLGAAYVRELACRGAAVVIADSGVLPDGSRPDPAPAQHLAQAITSQGGRAVACAADAGSEHGGQEAIELAINEFGTLDIVVANAGIIHNGTLPDWSTAQFEAQLHHHLLAAFHVVRPAFAVMKSAGYGRLVFVSSAAGVFGQAGLTGYAAAKTGMLGLMNVAAIEGADYGIKANAIMPMGDTRMATAILGEAANTQDARAFLETMRLDQVAPVVGYLASEKCTSTHATFSAFCGRVGLLQIGVTSGWFSPDSTLTAEDVATHLHEITDPGTMLVPSSIVDEIAYVTTSLAARTT